MNGLTLNDIFFLLPEAPEFITLAGQSWGGDLPGYDLLPLFGVLLLQLVLVVFFLRVWRKRVSGMRITVPILVLSAFGFFGVSAYHWVNALITAYGTEVAWTHAVDMILESIQVVAIILMFSAVLRINRYYHEPGASTYRTHS